MGDIADDEYFTGLDRYEGEGEDGIECEFCHTDGLHWEDTERGYRLAEGSGRLHVCPPDADGFEDLDA